MQNHHRKYPGNLEDSADQCSRASMQKKRRNQRKRQALAHMPRYTPAQSAAYCRQPIEVSIQEIEDHEYERSINIGRLAVGDPWGDCSIFMRRNLRSAKADHLCFPGSNSV